MKYLLGLGVIALIVIILAYFWLILGNGSQTVQEKKDETLAQLETQSGSNAPQVELNGLGSMNDLLARNTSLECQITTIDNSLASEGTFFVADQKIRGDFITQSPDVQETTVSSMVVVGDTMYVWTEIGGESYGVKSLRPVATEAAIETQEPVGLDERFKYFCQNWEPVDQSIFIPPTDVLFQDMSQVLQGGMEYGTVYEAGGRPY
jgi:hypothetical protein